MWGTIIEGRRAGQLGYRSQYAKIEEIILVNVPERESARIASFYKDALVSNGTHPGASPEEKKEISEDLNGIRKKAQEFALQQWQESLRKRGE